MTKGSFNAAYTESLGIESIRLLKIEPQQPSVPCETRISYQLVTYDLADCPTYTALSYTWGNPNGPDATPPAQDDVEFYVLLNGQRQQITLNLHHALLQLCNTKSDTYWWIDALCINQVDVSERTAQVSIMQKIYRNAETVSVWLGPDHNGDAAQVREFLRALLQKYLDFEMSKYEGQWLHQDDEHALQEAGLPPLENPIWSAVLRFWDRAWFNRVWVRQEVALAREVEIWCGQIEFTALEVIQASEFHAASGLGENLLRLRSSNPAKSVSGRKIGCRAANIADLFNYANGVRLAESVEFQLAMDRLTGPNSDDKHPLLRIFAQMMFYAYNDEASDNRDKVFVPLILMKQAAESYGVAEIPLIIDYSMSDRDVYLQAASWMVTESGFPGIFSLLPPDQAASPDPDAPSWVPTYSSSPFQQLLLFVENGPWRVDTLLGNLDPHLSPTVQGSSLHVHARYCGSIADTGDTFKSMIDDGCFELTARLLLNCPPIMSNGQTRLDVWRRTMCGASTVNPSSITSSRRADSPQDFRQWLIFFILRALVEDILCGNIKCGREHLAKMPSFELLAETDDSKMLPQWNFWTQAVANPELRVQCLAHRAAFPAIDIARRRLFRTNGPVYVGLGPETALPGDELWIVAGSALPVILRRVGGAHRVVGVSYIDDIAHVLENLGDGDWQPVEIR